MGQVHFENFDFLVKVKSPLSQSIFSFPFSYLIYLFIFFFFFSGGSDRVRFPGRSGSNRVGLEKGQPVVEDDVIHDAIPLEARVARASA